MKVNEQYTINHIKSTGLIEKAVKDVDAKIFTMENVGNKLFRLYSVINKRSFFL